MSSSTTTRPKTTRPTSTAPVARPRRRHRRRRHLVLWDQILEVERIQKRLGLMAPMDEVFSNDPRLANLSGWQVDEGAA